MYLHLSKLPKILSVIKSPFVILVNLNYSHVFGVTACSAQISKRYLQTSLIYMYIYHLGLSLNSEHFRPFFFLK